MMALLLEPLQFTFMSHALLISLVVSIPCALLSVFLVLKGWALMGDAMSHAVFPGIVLAWILGLPLATGAFVAGVFCAVATGYLKDNSRIKQDTVMGIVFSGMFAAGLILYIAVKPDVHLDTISDPSRHFAIIRSWSKAPSWQAGRQTPLLQPRT